MKQKSESTYQQTSHLGHCRRNWFNCSTFCRLYNKSSWDERSEVGILSLKLRSLTLCESYGCSHDLQTWSCHIFDPTFHAISTQVNDLCCISMSVCPKRISRMRAVNVDLDIVEMTPLTFFKNSYFLLIKWKRNDLYCE